MAIIYRDKIRGFEYEIETSRRPDERDYDPNSIRCYCDPFFGMPIRLTVYLMSDGSIKFLGWDWHGGDGTYSNNPYLHTDIVNSDSIDYKKDFCATSQQKETVAGLLSGRITWDGLKLHPGSTLQRAVGGLTTVDIANEEEKNGKKMMFA